jgi:hypothetical protein
MLLSKARTGAGCHKFVAADWNQTFLSICGPFGGAAPACRLDQKGLSPLDLSENRDPGPFGTQAA